MFVDVRYPMRTILSRANSDEEHYEDGGDDFHRTPQKQTAPTRTEASPPLDLHEDGESREGMCVLALDIVQVCLEIYTTDGFGRQI